MGHRHIVPLAIFLSLCFILVTLDTKSTDSFATPILDSVYHYVPKSFKTRPPPKNIDGLRIAVIEQTWYHDEVIGSVLNVLKDVGTDITFYRHQLNAGFGEVLKDIRDCEENPPWSVDSFKGHVEEEKYDVAVLVTGDKKFWAWRDRDIEAWNNAKNMHMIVILHESEWYEPKNEKPYGSRLPLQIPAKEGRLTIMTLGHHVEERMRKSLDEYVTEWNEPEWADVPILNFAPTFQVSAEVKASNPFPVRDNEAGGPSKAAILGRMNPKSRKYEAIIEDLQKAIAAEPELWGYKKVPTTRMDNENVTVHSHRYLPTRDPAHPPFTLNLIGQDEGKIQFPPELIDEEEGSEPIIVRHSDKSYSEFYNIIGTMDMILPAFQSELYTGYRASAAVASGVIAQTPILATPEILKGYTYLGGPAYRLQPPSLSEIETIAHLRRDLDPWDQAYFVTVRPPLDPFYGKTHWPGAPWSTYIKDLAARNADVWLDILYEVKVKKDLAFSDGALRAYEASKMMMEAETRQAVQGATLPGA